jgi:glycosyltransferase involved in cell wall biosynthesis
MSRVLLIGYNPPEIERHGKIEAANYRTWQFLQPLLADGNEVCLCADTPNVERATTCSLENAASQLIYQPICFQRCGWTGKLQDAHDNFEPDCIVAVNFAPCLYATKLHTDKPIWMDIYGDYITIIQVAGFRAGSNRGLATSLAFVKQVIETGDAFSTCSRAQMHMLVGELAMAGRLNWRTLGYQFVQTVLPGAPAIEVETVEKKSRKILLQHGVDNQDFIALWCGGYNTWTDIETLFRALDWAMAHDPKIHFVSIGANTYEAPDNVYVRFQRSIDRSQYRERFHMLGWRPWKEIGDYYRESDIGLNIDAMHYETIYGTRTRLVEMAAWGLPSITSLGCELSYLLGDRGAAMTFQIGDWHTLGEHLVTLARERDKIIALAKAALNYARNDLTFLVTTYPIRSWVRNPHGAPDRVALPFREQGRTLEYAGRTALRKVIWRIAGLYK